MILEVKVPSPGESITEVEIGNWLVEDGSVVAKGQEIIEIESDKATLTIVADKGGRIAIKAEEGQVLEVGAIVFTIDTSVEATAEVKLETQKDDEKTTTVSAIVANETKQEISTDKIKVTSVAKKMMSENNLSIEDVVNGLKRLGKKEVEAVLNTLVIGGNSAIQEDKPASREVIRVKMSMLRRKLSERLVSIKNETAMLTTFNEVDMSAVMAIRKQYQQKFVEKHGFKLGFMSFFAKACAIATSYHPTVNSMMDGDEIITPSYADIGIAVSTPKGLMVPIVRNAESKSIPEIELEIKQLAEKARNKKITVEELSGGTFTITNGGVFGSMLSTPIINPPQSAILGMHNIVERPVAIDGQVVIRPVMYVALSYDHRIIDGKDSVGFLVKVKQLLENPEYMLTNGKNPEELLLNL
ncbi:MAG: 2-oxoglutarate dehydrogenase complex dihydrolipoyllysine-residue succinyltransferase [Mariniphaga sp.]|nr:2-oxoglutarate dehydrogenase complex dihydrolipoyllysine-residue succinyltransferase [Mariniphaga sp.]